jgi:hypothetical protein
VLGTTTKCQQPTANWKSRKGNETAAVAKDEKSDPKVEYLLCSVEDELQSFPNSDQLFRNPNIWIGDAATTVHMSPHSEGMINIKKTQGGSTVGNGEVMIAKNTCDIPCEICDKHGNTLAKAMITNVALTKSAPLICSV